MEQDRAPDVLPHHSEPSWPPLVGHDVISNLIANTETAQRLKIRANLDTAGYPTGGKLTDQELAAVRLKPGASHGEWNNCILATRRKK